MKSLQEYIQEGILDNKETAIKNADKNIKYNYFPKNIKELETIVDKLINDRGNNTDLNDIYTGYITDISCLFERTKFNGDISTWKLNKNCLKNHMFIDCPIKEKYKPKGIK